MGEDIPGMKINPIYVDVMLQVITFADINLGDEYLDATVALAMKWVDPRLKWNPHYFGEKKNIRVDPDLIWIPDLEVVNRIHDFSSKTSCLASHFN